jgi:hypothetical protein
MVDDFLTNSFELLANNIFPFLCGRLPFIFLIATFIILAKVLADRANRIIHYIGIGLFIFLLYPLIIYMVNIDLTEPFCFEFSFSAGGTFGGFVVEETITETICISVPIFSILSIFSLLSLLGFIIVSIFNSRNIYFNDNTWLFFSALSSSFFSSIITMILFASTCTGSVFSLIIIVIYIFASVLIFFITEKFSKKRLK